MLSFGKVFLHDRGLLPGCPELAVHGDHVIKSGHRPSFTAGLSLNGELVLRLTTT